MGWTAPIDWSDSSDVPSAIVTAAMLNTDVRDNMLVLSTHTHTGAAGFGASSMTGLTLAALVTLTFADQEDNPDAAGELQRNGNDILWYGSSVVNLSAADASAGTASLRSLGTTSVKAAAGNHTHEPVSRAVGLTENQFDSLNDDDEHTMATVTATPGATSRAWICYGTYTVIGSDSNIYTVKLKFDSTILETRTGLQPSATGNVHYDTFIVAGIQLSPSVGSHTVTTTVQRTSGSSSYGSVGGAGFREVSA